jgi:hypothetical protein
MTQLLIRALISGILVAVIALIARREPTIGALVASLPLISILAVIWLWGDTKDGALIANHLEATFWLVLPSLPMFLLIPKLLRSGISFWLALAMGIILTIALYIGGTTLMDKWKTAQ